MKIIRIRKCYDCNHKRYNAQKGWWCIKEGRAIDFVHGKIPYWCGLEDAPPFADSNKVVTTCWGAHIDWKDAPKAEKED